MDIEIKRILQELGIATGLGFFSWLFLGANAGTVFTLTLLIRYCTRDTEGNF